MGMSHVIADHVRPVVSDTCWCPAWRSVTRLGLERVTAQTLAHAGCQHAVVYCTWRPGMHFVSCQACSYCMYCQGRWQKRCGEV
jgi:hypothetical protein